MAGAGENHSGEVPGALRAPSQIYALEDIVEGFPKEIKFHLSLGKELGFGRREE